MTEQIEVLGQFDVRRDVVPADPEEKKMGKMTIDKQRIKNTFGGDQLDAAVDSVRDKKRYVTGYSDPPKKFYISRKDCPVHNFCEELAGPNKRSEGIQMFDVLFWSSWVACNEMPKDAQEWLDARVKDYKDGSRIDFVCDCRKFRGNDADKTQASEMTRAEYPHDCHGYTLKRYIEEEAKKSNN